MANPEMISQFYVIEEDAQLRIARCRDGGSESDADNADTWISRMEWIDMRRDNEAFMDERNIGYNNRKEDFMSVEDAVNVYLQEKFWADAETHQDFAGILYDKLSSTLLPFIIRALAGNNSFSGFKDGYCLLNSKPRIKNFIPWIDYFDAHHEYAGTIYHFTEALCRLDSVSMLSHLRTQMISLSRHARKGLYLDALPNTPLSVLTALAVKLHASGSSFESRTLYCDGS